MRGVEQGEFCKVSRRGVPIARLVTITEVSDLRCDRPARAQISFSSLARVRSGVSSAGAPDEVRGDR